MRAVLDATATVALLILFLVAPSVGLLVCGIGGELARSCQSVARGHRGARGTKNPDRCSVCGEDPEQRRVVREMAAAAQRRRLARLGVGGQAAKPEDEALRRVVLARTYKDTAYLIEALRDPDPTVRSVAARYLGALGVVEATPALLRLLRAANAGVRSAGATALGRLQSSEAVPELIALAENDRDLASQTHAIGALGKIGDARAMPVLLRLLASPHWVVRDCAARALGSCGDATAIEELRAAAARERLLLRGPLRKAVRQIRRRSRSGKLAIQWPAVKPGTRRRLLIVGVRLAVFGGIFITLLKLSPRNVREHVPG